MVIDYGALPPEINSGRMYVGPGSGPMLAAAGAWDSLAAELYSAAARYSAVISGLTARWQGAASLAMTAAAAPYAAWTMMTAARAEQTANQARTAAAAYETAFAETVPPSVVTANRTQLLTLTATNFFGQNTPAIMETQAQYLEMWAQDAAAMYGYAGTSATVTQLTPFSSPPQSTDPAGTAAQAAVVAQATGVAAEAHAQTLPQLMSAVPSSLQSLAVPAASKTSTAAPESFASSLNSIANYVNGPTSPLSMFTIGSVPELLGAQGYLVPQAGVVLTEAAAKLAATAPLTSVGWLHSGAGGLGSAVSAGMARAGFVGGLSVPQGWVMAAPAIKPVAAVFTENAMAGAPAAAATQGNGTLFGNMALSSLAGRAMVGTGGPSARATGSAGAAAVGEASGPVNIFIVPAAPQ